MKTCHPCQLHRNNPPPSPLIPWEFPQRPWKRVHADFAGPYEGKMFLILVDAFSKVTPMSTATSATTIDVLRAIFATHGLPEAFVTDNGPQFTSAEFKTFVEKNGIRHLRSAPYHPATNGLAERSCTIVQKKHGEKCRRLNQHQSLKVSVSLSKNTSHHLTPPREYHQLNSCLVAFRGHI